MSDTHDSELFLVDPNDPGGHVNLAIYRRTTRPMQHIPSQSNEIYIRSQRAIAPIHKRITKLFFDEQLPSVIIHAAGKNILQAVKVATDFCNHHTPWFETSVQTSTEIVYDDYIPIVNMIGNTNPSSSSSDTHDNPTTTTTTTGKQKRPAILTSKDKDSSSTIDITAGKDSHGDDTHFDELANQRKTRKKKASANKSDARDDEDGDNTDDTQSIVSLSTSSPSSVDQKSQQSSQDLKVLQPFFRCRMISAIHITISKTPLGVQNVK